MASTVKQWTDGDSVTFAYNGDGDGSVSVASDVNEGIDRSITIQVETTAGSPEVTQAVTINQIGLREVFNTSDGPFLLSDNSTFNVLKE